MTSVKSCGDFSAISKKVQDNLDKFEGRASILI
jgi:hypothetical protein